MGRPISFKGDPDDEGLDEDEKRRIKRRIANRESARRVRQKRQDLMEEQQVKVGRAEPGHPVRRCEGGVPVGDASDTCV